MQDNKYFFEAFVPIKRSLCHTYLEWGHYSVLWVFLKF